MRKATTVKIADATLRVGGQYHVYDRGEVRTYSVVEHPVFGAMVHFDNSKCFKNRQRCVARAIALASKDLEFWTQVVARLKEQLDP